MLLAIMILESCDSKRYDRKIYDRKSCDMKRKKGLGLYIKIFCYHNKLMCGNLQGYICWKNVTIFFVMSEENSFQCLIFIKRCKIWYKVLKNTKYWSPLLCVEEAIKEIVSERVTPGENDRDTAGTVISTQ